MVVDVLEILTVIFAISIFSWVFKPNPVHRIAESLYIGANAGYLLVTNLNNAYKTGVTPLSKNIVLAIPLILGVMMYARLTKKYGYISNYPIAVLTAVGLAVATRAIVQSDVIEQIINTAIPLLVPASPQQTLGNIVIVISVVSSLFYFTYATEHTGAKNIFARTGISFMMIGFGANAANIIMGRASRFITMLGFIMVPSGYYVVPIMTVIIALSIYLEQKGYI